MVIGTFVVLEHGEDHLELHHAVGADAHLAKGDTLQLVDHLKNLRATQEQIRTETET